jgi:hypothetical protein
MDHNIIRVPRVYRFFNDNSDLGYIIMEYMAGRLLNRGKIPLILRRSFVYLSISPPFVKIF